MSENTATWKEGWLVMEGANFLQSNISELYYLLCMNSRFAPGALLASL